MKKFLAIAGLLLASTGAWAEGIEFFHGTWDEALAKAKEEKKLVFVDVYTEWCGPCKMMSKDVFTKDEVGEYYNAKFINYKLDAENEEQNGPELAEKYEIQGYPSFLYLDGNGDVQHRGIGGMDAGTFIAMAEVANGEGTTFAELEAKYQAGDRSVELIREYLKKAPMHRTTLPHDEQSAFQEATSSVAEEYLNGLSGEQLLTKEEFALINSFMSGPTRGKQTVEFVISNRDKYIELTSKPEVAKFIGQVNYYTVKQLAEAGDDSYKTFVEEISGDLAPLYTELDWFDGMDPYEAMVEFAGAIYALALKDWETYIELSQTSVDRQGDKVSTRELLSISKDLMKAGCEDQKVLERVVKFNRMAYEKKNDLYTAPAYGKLLAKLGDNDSAKKVLEGAIAKCDEFGPRAEKLKKDLEGVVATL